MYVCTARFQAQFLPILVSKSLPIVVSCQKPCNSQWKEHYFVPFLLFCPSVQIEIPTQRYWPSIGARRDVPPLVSGAYNCTETQGPINK